MIQQIVSDGGSGRENHGVGLFENYVRLQKIINTVNERDGTYTQEKQ